MTARRIRITGFVQGVFFRSSTKDKAEGLGITGWVRNLYDGSVDMHVEGADKEMKEFVEWVHTGPPAAKIRTVEVDVVQEVGYPSFEEEPRD